MDYNCVPYTVPEPQVHLLQRRPSLVPAARRNAQLMYTTPCIVSTKVGDCVLTLAF